MPEETTEQPEYYPAYFVQNGIPSLETAQNMVVFLDWCRDNERTPYVTTNAGKPGGGSGCPPLGCH